MIVLIVGASGFIGSRLAQAFSAAGHEVVCAGRNPSGIPPRDCPRTVAIDFAVPADPVSLSRALAGVDVVINAVGILRESRSQTFDALHARGPRTLFAACEAVGVRRVIQISALGAGPNPESGYHRSKHEADHFLSGLSLDWAIVKPSLVYGPGGSSAQLFDALATAPITPLPGHGEQLVQPVYIDDLIAAVLELAQSAVALRCVLAVVGPTPLRMRDFLTRLRATHGLGRARLLPIPMPFMRMAARIGARLPGNLLDRETLAMLERGNVADAAPLARLLGRQPLPVESFVPWGERATRRIAAVTRWPALALRVAIAAMWLIAGAVSLGPHPVEASRTLLVSIGIPASLAPLALYGAAALDIALGIATLAPRRPRWLWSAQMLLVIAYTAIISWRLPALWLEPFGPVAKNLPILAALWLLQRLEPRR